MKHLKTFNEAVNTIKKSRIQELFKDRINWVFFNNIKDLLTIYEDKGLSTTLSVCLLIKGQYINSYLPIYKYSSSEEHNYDGYLDIVDTLKEDDFINSYSNYGIFYDIFIETFESGDGEYMDDEMEELKNKIKSKSTFFEDENTGNILVQPK